MARRPSTQVYLRLLGYLRPYRLRLAAGLLASLAVAAATSSYAWVLGPLLKAVLTEAPVEVGPWRLEGPTVLRVMPLLMVGVAAAKALAQFFQAGWMQRLGQRVMADLRESLYERLLVQPPAFYEQRHSGELLSRFSADIPLVEFSVTQALSSYVKDGLMVITLLVSCFLIDARLFVLGFIAMPLTVVPVTRFARSLKRVAKQSQASLGALTALTSEQLQNLPVVQAYRGEPRALQVFDGETDRYLAAMRRSLFIRGAFSPTVEILGVFGVACVVALGAKAVAGDPALAGRILSFIAATLLLYQPLKSLSGTASNVLSGVAAAERLFEWVDVPAPVDRGDDAGPLRTALVFEDVKAAHPDGRQALRGVSFSVPAGSRVALVGSSGAGKTSLLSVLLGFLPTTEGRVLWDGVPTQQLRQSRILAQLAWVPQEPVLFSGSVRYNLLLARPNATEAELWEALKLAHAETFVRGFEGGLEEGVGERGARLSGGQRQRLVMARAFLRRPSLLLLDEPTSALDAASEAAVSEGLKTLMEGRTVLVVAHRLSTVMDADLIVVMDQGSVVEAGRHEELVKRQGRYAQLLGELSHSVAG